MQTKLKGQVRRHASRLLRPFSVFESSELLWHPSLRPALIILISGIAISVLVWRLVDMAIVAQTKKQFEELSSRVPAQMHLTMTAYEQVLRGTAGLFRVRRDISREDFRRFTSALELNRTYPDLQGIGYVMLLSPSQLERHIEVIRRSGDPQYDIRPEGDRPLYSTILYIEPLDWRNKRAIGYDMYSEPTRREAMQRARDEAKPALSGRVILVQETSPDPQAGFLLYMPLYENGKPRGTLEERRANIAGFVYAPFRASTLINTILNKELSWVREKLNFAIYDGQGVRPSHLLYQTDGYGESETNSSLTLISETNVFGRTWTFSYVSTPAFDEDVSHVASHLALISSLVLTGILFLFIAAKSIRELQLAQLNHQMSLLTRELSHRVKNTLAVVQSIASRSLSGRQSVAEAQEVFMRRLHALAHAHTLLFENLWSGASLHALARQELDAFGARATIRGPEIHLNPASAQMLALILHELGTNAAKYGSMSSTTGALDVNWWVEVREGQPTFHFRWKETGGPPVVPPSHRGFGRTLLKQRLGHGGASPEISFAPTGLVYEVASPLTSITAMREDDDEMARLLEMAANNVEDGKD
jgi:CHASE1-domain containing sensor protein/two-component sensor histidine kinase